MPEISSYKKLSSKLWKIQRGSPLGATTIAVYFYIISQLKKQNKSEISLSDTEISKAIGINRNTVRVCREKLKSSGLLTFKMTRNQPPVYSFYEANLPEESPIDKNNSEVNKLLDINSETPVIPDKTLTNIQSENEFPSLETFLEFAKSLESLDEEMELAVAERYNSLNANGWKNAFGKPIINWQQTLKNSLPYLRKDVNQLKLRNIPEITHPPIN
ncbi:hypothetical protein [Chryseobacterium taklimakanense]|uniref:Uncharacterized protein n=1 Tax=Chryseobacterium taklimakanense TaxID=536441 RepID=A0A3G8WR08_9FLAO|nr:hypothetical protein [Chryseobacterium taklimakanense]AZI20624.1 hypothetical protein EIH08_07780 [Chryseobacterium taklimakanense]